TLPSRRTSDLPRLSFQGVCRALIPHRTSERSRQAYRPASSNPWQENQNARFLTGERIHYSSGWNFPGWRLGISGLARGIQDRGHDTPYPQRHPYQNPTTPANSRAYILRGKADKGLVRETIP